MSWTKWVGHPYLGSRLYRASMEETILDANQRGEDYPFPVSLNLSESINLVNLKAEISVSALKRRCNSEHLCSKKRDKAPPYLYRQRS